MTVTYFGLNDTTPDLYAAAIADFATVNNAAVIAYTCPGIGPQNLRELSVFARRNAITGQHVIVGIYSSTGTTLLYSVAVVVDNTTADWKGLLVTDTPPGITLTGGTQYLLAINVEHADTQIGDNNLVDGIKYKVAVYPSLPAPYGTEDGLAPFETCIRCGVEPGVGAPIFGPNSPICNSVIVR